MRLREYTAEVSFRSTYVHAIVDQNTYLEIKWMAVAVPALIISKDQDGSDDGMCDALRRWIGP